MGYLDKQQELKKLCDKYGEQRVFASFKKLKDRNKRILELYFGINNENRKSVKEIADLFNVSEIAVYKVIERTIEKTKNFLEDKDLLSLYEKPKKDNLLKKYEQYGKEVFLNELERRLPEDVKLFCSYYGIKGQKAKNASELAEIYNCDKKEIYNRIKNILDAIDKSLNNKDGIRRAQKNTRLDNIIKNYDKEKIKECVKFLKGKNKDIMLLYLGLNEEEPKSSAEISRILDASVGSINTMIWKSTVDIQQMLETGVVKKRTHSQMKKQKLLENLYNIYGKEKFFDSINTLGKKEKNIIEHYYGVNGQVEMSSSELAICFNLAEDELLRIIRRARYKIFKKIKSDNEKKYNVLVEMNKMIERYGEENVLDAINLLEPRIKNLLKAHIDNKENLSQETEDVIKKAFRMIGIMLDDTPVELGKLYSKYGKGKVNKAIDRLSDKEKWFIKTYLKRKSEKREKYFVELLLTIEEEIFDLEDDKLTKEQLILKREKMFKQSLKSSDEEKVKLALENLYPRELKLLMAYYNLIGQANSINEIANATKTTNLEVRKNLKKVINKINQNIIEQKKMK